MIRRIAIAVASVATLAACSESTMPTDPAADVQVELSKTAKGGRAGSLGVVYVTSQHLYYDTFVSAEKLPPHGRFQKLVDGTTEFGPGQPGYLGGRWWIDANEDGMQNEGDVYLLCPLLGPGRTSP